MLRGIQNIKENTSTDPTMLSAKNFPVKKEIHPISEADKIYLGPVLRILQIFFKW